MSLVEFFYTPEPLVDQKTYRLRHVYRPKVPIKLGYNRKISEYHLECLIDSGADFNVLPAQFGEHLGIPIKKGKKLEMVGIGNKSITVYEHNVWLYMPVDHGFKTTVYFSYHQQLPLLGRTGFFDKVESVEFREKERKVVIKFIETTEGD